MALYRLCVYEVGEKIPTWSVYTKAREPAALARRYLRFVNHACGGPGGNDRTVSKADVTRINIWPDGESLINTVRAR